MIASADWTPIREKIITISIFCNESIDTLESISISDLNRVYEQLAKVLDNAFNTPLKPIIKIDGKKFGFVPRLQDMTTGEWVDLEEELREAGDLWSAMGNVLAILYRPIVKSKWWNRWKWWVDYQIEPYTAQHMENSDRMKEVDMETASGMAVFFWSLGAKYTQSFTQSTQEPSLTTQTI